MNTDNWLIQSNYDNKLARSSHAVTRPITKADMGIRTDDLDLALTFDPATRTYNRR